PLTMTPPAMWPPPHPEHDPEVCGLDPATDCARCRAAFVADLEAWAEERDRREAEARRRHSRPKVERLFALLREQPDLCGQFLGDALPEVLLPALLNVAGTDGPTLKRALWAILRGGGQ